MMRTATLAFKSVLCLVLVVGLAAQGQVAIVTSDSPFDLRGVRVDPGKGVPTWPILPGDVIKAGQTPLTVVYPDGSTVLLSPGSEAKIDISGQTPVFDLEDGSAHYTLKTNGAVILKTGTNVVNPKDLIGDLQIGGKKPQAGWWTAGHTTAVVAGAAGAVALGVAVTQGKPGNPSPANCKDNGNGNGGKPSSCP